MLIRLLWTLCRKATRLLEVWHKEGFGAMLVALRNRFHPEKGIDPSIWIVKHRPGAALLQKFRETDWPANAPSISILVPVYNTRADWLAEMIASVREQTYPKWQLILANDASPAEHIRPQLDAAAAQDTRIVVVHLERNGGVSVASNAALARASGDYVGFLDHDDTLEPHALHRLAQAILGEQQPDLLYTDEAITGPDVNHILVIRGRPAFSYDYYLNHPYFVHFIACKTEIVRRVGGWDERMTISQDVDLVLRLLEQCQRVTHVPDVLYRWRTHPTSLGHQQKDAVLNATTGALSRHLDRLQVPATVLPSRELFNVYEVRFPIDPQSRVCILIPTKNQVEFLRDCIESLERTVPPGLAEIVVIDHASDDPATQGYLKSIQPRHRVVAVDGPFNFSRIMNRGVALARHPKYTHYLLLNNDIVAPRAGWLERMLEFGCREDVGAVGAMLVYPDDTVQHAGVVIGLGAAGPADHAYRSAKFSQTFFIRDAGENGALVCNRDYSAVTAACLLIRVELYERLGGFDEEMGVDYSDTDLCLRLKDLGYKNLTACEAVLIHFESKSRGKTPPNPQDLARFQQKHAQIIREGDPYTSPHLRATHTWMRVLTDRPVAEERVRSRTVTVVPPRVKVANQTRPIEFPEANRAAS